MEKATIATVELTQNYEPVEGDSYKVKIEVFEGPLDLLLFLIRKEEVSIYDIPIARITDQYLDYLKEIEELDIGVAGEFLLMAATLIQIKSQMLLPRDPLASNEEIDDPRKELIEQLLDHQKFKAAANAFHQLGTIEAAAFLRGTLESDLQNPEITATVFQLFQVFQEVMARKRAVTEIEIVRDEVTMAQKIAEIRSMVEAEKEVKARDLFERSRSKREMVLIFLGILELVKELVVRLMQSELFGEIVLIKRSAEAD